MTSTLDKLLENIENTPEAEIYFTHNDRSGTQERISLFVAPENGMYSITELNAFQKSIIGTLKPFLDLEIEFRQDYLGNFFADTSFFEGWKKGLRPGSASFIERYYPTNNSPVNRFIMLKLSPNKQIIEESIKEWVDSGRKEKGYGPCMPWAIKYSDLPRMRK